MFRRHAAFTRRRPAAASVTFNNITCCCFSVGGVVLLQLTPHEIICSRFASSSDNQSNSSNNATTTAGGNTSAPPTVKIKLPKMSMASKEDARVLRLLNMAKEGTSQRDKQQQASFPSSSKATTNKSPPFMPSSNTPSSASPASSSLGRRTTKRATAGDDDVFVSVPYNRGKIPQTGKGPTEVDGILGKSSMLPKMRMQPLNPRQMDKETSEMVSRPPGKDVEFVTNKASRKKLSNIKFSDAQTDAIIDAYAAKQWYSFAWKAVRWVNPHNVKRNKQIIRLGVLICLFVLLGIIWYFYHLEMDCFAQMEPQDQADFKKVIFGARIGEVRDAGEAALDRVDPLRVLPNKEKMRIVVQAWRDAGYVDRDWELHARTRKSLWKEPDFLHIFYWTILTFGRTFIGGGLMWYGIEEEQLNYEEKQRKRDAKEKRASMISSADNNISRSSISSPTNSDPLTVDGSKSRIVSPVTASSSSSSTISAVH